MNEKTIHSDLTVVGGGIAGMCAALAAARHGLKVALVEWRDVLGGNNSSEHRVHLNGGAGNVSYYGREAGIADELKLSVFHYNPRYNFKMDYDLTDMTFFNIINAEPNISLYLGTAIYDAEAENGHIVCAYGHKVRTEEKLRFEAPLFADASGDGILAMSVGARYHKGREAQDEYNESLAPKNTDSHTMGSCILFTVAKADKSVPFIRPEFAYDYKKDNILKYVERPETLRSLPKKLDGLDGIWWLSYGGMNDTVADADYINLELKKLVYGFWDYVKNSGEYPDSANYYISWIAPVPSKRESRRFIGDYVITQNDLQNQTDFYDAVSSGGWSVDVHDPGGVYGNERTSMFAPIHGLYGLPYRAAYSANIDNLFLCGRIASMTHIALGSIRVMQTLGAFAQAAGTAAYLCHRDGVLPRDISAAERIKELQELLQRDGQYIPGLMEAVGEVDNAHISSSCTAQFKCTDKSRLFELNERLTLALPIVNGIFEGVSLALSNNTDIERTVYLHLYATRANDAYEAAEERGMASVILPPHCDGFFPFAFNLTKLPHHAVLLEIDTCPGVSVYASPTRLTGAPCFIAGTDGKIAKRLQIIEHPKEIQAYTICFSDITPTKNFFAAENVADGFSRPQGLPHSWCAPITEQPTITLEWDNPCNLSEIQIIFNAQLDTDHFSSKIETLVRDYSLTVACDEGEKIFNSDNNYLGRIVVKSCFKKVRKIELKINATYGSPYAEVFAIKAFK